MAYAFNIIFTFCTCPGWIRRKVFHSQPRRPMNRFQYSARPVEPAPQPQVVQHSVRLWPPKFRNDILLALDDPNRADSVALNHRQPRTRLSRRHRRRHTRTCTCRNLLHQSHETAQSAALTCSETRRTAICTFLAYLKEVANPECSIFWNCSCGRCGQSRATPRTKLRSKPGTWVVSRWSRVRAVGRGHDQESSSS